eukprot:scaffold14176_cov50-Prasinocladus_malaysianus.AAC.3
MLVLGSRKAESAGWAVEAGMVADIWDSCVGEVTGGVGVEIRDGFVSGVEVGTGEGCVCGVEVVRVVVVSFGCPSRVDVGVPVGITGGLVSVIDRA